MSRVILPVPANPVFVREPKTSYAWPVIILVTLIVISIVAALIVYSIFRNRAAKNINRCEPGLCVIRYDTGLKRCPNSPNERLVFNPVFEGCTSGNYCQADAARCAVLPGGVLDCDGVCGVGNERCRCEDAP